MPLIDLTEGEIEGLLDMDSRNLMFADKPSLRKSLLAKLRNPQAGALERLEKWKAQGHGRRWEISRTTNIATVTLFFGGIAYTCMQPTLEAAVIGALIMVQGVDHDNNR